MEREVEVPRAPHERVTVQGTLQTHLYIGVQGFPWGLNLEQTINKTIRSKRMKKLPRVIAGMTEFCVLQNAYFQSDGKFLNLYALAP